MVVDVSGPLLNEECDRHEDAVDGTDVNKQTQGKPPKKVLKAEREKLKREQLNEHFNRLASVLELNDPNNGKASILSETIRFLNDLICQIQHLIRENATLLSESQYMTAEKNELRDETSALEAQIKKIQSEIEDILNQYKPDLNVAPPETWQEEMASHFVESHLPQLPAVDPSAPQPPILGPLFVFPVGPDLQAFQKADMASNPPAAVSNPQARYPTSADSWPWHLLLKQPGSTS